MTAGQYRTCPDCGIQVQAVYPKWDGMEPDAPLGTTLDGLAAHYRVVHPNRNLQRDLDTGHRGYVGG